MGKKVWDNKWRELRRLTPGGQANVYEVVNVSEASKSTFVLKEISRPNSKNIGRFKAGLKSIQELDHPGIIKLVEANLERSNRYYVMEFHRRGDLRFEYVSTISLIEKLQVFANICDAVAVAHEKNIVHRDLKPRNILIADKGFPVVTDFDICLHLDGEEERLTVVGEVVGSRKFAAPEQRDSKDSDKISPKSDVYSLGKILYWLFRGDVMDGEDFADPFWDLRKSAEFSHSIHFIHDIFARTIVRNIDDRLPNAKDLGAEVYRIMNVINNDGRYLDADIPSNCLFCGIGQYSKKSILPRITALPYREHIDQTRNYQLVYADPFGAGDGSSNISVTRGEGNVRPHLYPRHLILECDHCGNLQFFKFDNNDKPVWKNALPEVPADN
ncbi:MAG: serine/threonine-protein kinase [Pyrinomonadaceae bacterium]